MSYSFAFVAPTKSAAKTQVIKEMKAVVDAQPGHKKDYHAAVVSAHAYIDMLADDPQRHVSVAIYGSVSWHFNPHDYNGTGDDLDFTNASINVSAAHVMPEQAAA